jgi:hypothetical protein
VFSGVPSTAWSLVTGGDLLASTEAAGTLLVAPTSSRFRLLVAGVAAHLVISFGWAQVLARLLPKRHTAMAGAVAGGPQVLDHLAYGALVGAVLATRRGR